MRRRTLAAMVLYNSWKTHTARKTLQDRLALRNKYDAVRVIQGGLRGHCARRAKNRAVQEKEENWKRAVHCITFWWFQVRESTTVSNRTGFCTDIRPETAAQFVQNNFRIHIAKKSLISSRKSREEILERARLCIGAACCRWAQRFSYQEACRHAEEENASNVIFGAWQCHLDRVYVKRRKQLREHHKMTVQLQAAARRLAVGQMIAEWRTSVSKIVDCYRYHRARLVLGEERSRRNKEVRSAVMLQRLWREHRARIITYLEQEKLALQTLCHSNQVQCTNEAETERQESISYGGFAFCPRPPNHSRPEARTPSNGRRCRTASSGAGRPLKMTYGTVKDGPSEIDASATSRKELFLLDRSEEQSLKENQQRINAEIVKNSASNRPKELFPHEIAQGSPAAARLAFKSQGHKIRMTSTRI